MRILSGEEEEEAIKYFNFAADMARRHSLCLRAKTGAVIVNDGVAFSIGYNSPPERKRLERCLKDDLPDEFKSDKTCCIHAEQVAINNALKHDPERLKGSRIYFVRVDEDGNIERAGKPYCTDCSKEILFEHIDEVALWHDEGICVYDSKEYNALSFRHGEWVDET